MSIVFAGSNEFDLHLGGSVFGVYACPKHVELSLRLPKQCFPSQYLELPFECHLLCSLYRLHQQSDGLRSFSLGAFLSGVLASTIEKMSTLEREIRLQINRHLRCEVKDKWHWARNNKMNTDHWDPVKIFRTGSTRGNCTTCVVKLIRLRGSCCPESKYMISLSDLDLVASFGYYSANFACI